MADGIKIEISDSPGISISSNGSMSKKMFEISSSEYLQVRQKMLEILKAFGVKLTDYVKMHNQASESPPDILPTAVDTDGSP